MIKSPVPTWSRRCPTLGLLGLLLLLAAIPARGAEPGEEPIVYVVLTERANSVTVSSDGLFYVGRWGTHRSPVAVQAGQTWVFAATNGHLKITDHVGRSRGDYAEAIYAYPGDPAKPLIFNGKRYRGELIVSSVGAGKVRAVNAVGLEGYLKGVVPAEIGRLGEDGFEALKAQAVAARSYTIHQMAERSHNPFDVTPDETDQVYEGMEGEHPLANRAVDSTRGIAGVHGKHVIRANYCSTCGGKTALASAVWSNRREDFEYLRARRDSEGGREFCSWSPFYRWEEVWGCQEFKESVRKNLWRGVRKLKGKDPGPVEKLKILSRTPSGRVRELAVWTKSGRHIVRGDRVRWVLRRTDGGPLRSAYLGALRREERDGRCVLVLEGGGYGHGVGLCQTGAIEMSRQGYTYQQILGHYYTGIRLSRLYNGESLAHGAGQLAASRRNGS